MLELTYKITDYAYMRYMGASMGMKLQKKIVFNSPVILTFAGISLLAFLINYITKGNSNQLLFSVYNSSALNPLFYIRLVGHVFGHADWAHFTGNITLLLLLGPLLEEKYGSRNIGLIIVLTAVVTGLLHIFLFPGTALLGASGVVFTFILLSSLSSMKDDRIPLTFIIVAIIYIGGQIVDGLFIKDNISNITHIAGGVLGGIFGYLLNRKKLR